MIYDLITKYQHYSITDGESSDYIFAMAIKNLLIFAIGLSLGTLITWFLFSFIVLNVPKMRDSVENKKINTFNIKFKDQQIRKIFVNPTNIYEAFESIILSIYFYTFLRKRSTLTTKDLKRSKYIFYTGFTLLIILTIMANMFIINIDLNYKHKKALTIK